MTLSDWVNSLDNPTNARYAAAKLWQQGMRASDRTVIQLCYGYNDHDADILCARLAELEQIAEVRLKDYNPDLGF